MTVYEYHHVVSFEETNVVGNVYYVHPIRWQGRCRELFLRDHAPQVIAELSEGLRLVTLGCRCEYLAEMFAGDDITVKMTLVEQGPNRIGMEFEYVRGSGEAEEVVARGRQDVACFRDMGGEVQPTPIPDALREALRPFGGG